jgi:hypothetical protein
MKPDIYTAHELEKPVTYPYAVIVEALEKGSIDEELGLMRWGSNYTFLVTVRHQDVCFLAVYKPRIGERPLWDFPDGTLCQREAAAWVVSEAADWTLVPPTLLREGPRGIGSVQVFIEHDPNRHYFTFDETHADQLKAMAAFDAITNNADRKGGHCLLDCDNHIWGIDHGLTFNTANKLRTVIWDYAGQPIPDDIVQHLSQLCARLDNPADTLHGVLTPLLVKGEVRALHSRLKRLINTKVYPMPGPGPNRPWPAV